MKDDWAYGAEDCMALGADRALENADTYQQYAQGELPTSSFLRLYLVPIESAY